MKSIVKVGDNLIDVKKTIQSLNLLYDYGEILKNDLLEYLIELGFIVKASDKYLISRKWINFSGKVTKQDFIYSLVCYYPSILDHLLSKIYKEAYAIGQSGDGEALFEFINEIPKFAEKIFELKDSKVAETVDIKSIYGTIFGGYPKYRSILTRLKFMQLVEEKKDTENVIMGTTPDESWNLNRKIASNIDLDILECKNKFTLTPYNYSDFDVKDDIKEILSQPWKTFVIILGMVISEYSAEGFGGISIRPTDIKNPFNEQELNFYISDAKGKENKIGMLNQFVRKFCIANNLYLFPDKAPDVDRVVFRLMDKKQFTYKDAEYILTPEFDDRLYSQEGILIKNRSRKFKTVLKDYIEGIRLEL